MAFKMKGTAFYGKSSQSPISQKQQGPIPEQNIGEQPGEHEDTYVYGGSKKSERLIDYDERAGVLEQNELMDSDEYLGDGDAKKGAEKRKVIETTIKDLDREQQIMRDRDE